MEGFESWFGDDVESRLGRIGGRSNAICVDGRVIGSEIETSGVGLGIWSAMIGGGDHGLESDFAIGSTFDGSV